MITIGKPSLKVGDFLTIKKVTRKWWIFWKIESTQDFPPMIVFTGNTKIRGDLDVAGDVRIGTGLTLSVTGNANMHHIYASKLITGAIQGDPQGTVGETIITTNETVQDYLKRMEKKGEDDAEM